VGGSQKCAREWPATGKPLKPEVLKFLDDPETRNAKIMRASSAQLFEPRPGDLR
jgi:hypothetical protein